MALDKHSIQRQDFPIGRRGYEPEAVDAHLSAIAAEVAELTSAAGQGSGSLAATASSQVRAIVEAAESTAAEIRGEAEREAQRLREAAEGETQQLRVQAEEDAQRLRAEAESAAQQLRGQAEGEAQQLRAQAEGEAQQLRAQAEGEAQQLHVEAEEEAQRLRAEGQSEAHRIRTEAEAEAQRVRAEASSEAERVRAEANSEAERVRAQANSEAVAVHERVKAQASELIARMSVSASTALAQIEAAERDLGTVVDSLRGGATTLAVDLQTLEGDLAAAQPSVPEAGWQAASSEEEPPSADEATATEALPDEAAVFEFQPEPEPVAELVSLPEPAAWEDGQAGPEQETNDVTVPVAEFETGSVVELARVLESEASEDVLEAGPRMSVPPPSNGVAEPHLRPVPLVPVEPVREVASLEDEMLASGGLADAGLRFEQVQPRVAASGPASGGTDPDAEGARLIALNMALNGSSREEVDHYLDENFNLANRAALLDEVYSSVEG